MPGREIIQDDAWGAANARKNLNLCVDTTEQPAQFTPTPPDADAFFQLSLLQLVPAVA
jgi:hypothetical protein